MDMNVLYAIAVVVATVGVIYGTLRLKKKGLVSQEDLTYVSTVLNLSLAVIDELDLAKEQEIKRIGNIVLDSLNMTVGLYGLETNKDDLILIGKDFAFKRCEGLGVELTDSRKAIIVNLLELALNEKLLEVAKK